MSARVEQETEDEEAKNRLNSIESSIASSDGISDVVAFSLCSLCSIRLNYLYPEPYHKPFRISTVKLIIDHFKLPTRIEHSVQEFVTDDEFTFLSSIKHNHREKTFKLIEELVLLAIDSGSYDARMHYLIIDVAELLGIPRDLVEIHCDSIYYLLLSAQGVEQTSDDEKYREKRDTRKKIKKYLVIGLASLGGGAVIGVTGGLAAPIVASAFGAALGAGTVVMSTAAAGVVGSLFGVAGAGLTASKMNKRIGDLEEFSFESLSPENDQTSLNVTIAISGWITDESEQQFARPWRNLNHTKEQYCLRYESKYLLELSQAMDYLLSFVVSYAAQEALKYTFLAGVMAAIAWPTALISMANIIDNPWDVCVGRSAEAGKHLADVLMSRQQGKRPVSLIGFSLGARVIFFCLQELAQRKCSEGIVCDVVLLGAPVTASLDQWKPLGRIISGRVINGYSSSDWLLKFLYRTSSAAIRVAGLQELCWQDKRVKNVDLTPLVGGHMDYYKKLTEILDFVNIRTVVQVEDDLTAKVLSSTNQPNEPGLKRNLPSRNSMVVSGITTPQPHSSASDSGIERTISESTNISTSFSQQSLQNQQALLDSTLPAGSLDGAEIEKTMITSTLSADSNEKNNNQDNKPTKDQQQKALLAGLDNDSKLIQTSKQTKVSDKAAIDELARGRSRAASDESTGQSKCFLPQSRCRASSTNSGYGPSAIVWRFRAQRLHNLNGLQPKTFDTAGQLSASLQRTRSKSI